MTLVFLFILGLFIGSFLNMLIDRLPREEQIVKGRSKCDHCHHVLAWFDLIPVMSWVLLSGRCRYCKKPIDVRNTVVELITGTLFVVTAVSLVPRIVNNVSGMDLAQLVLSVTIVSCLVVIFFIDLKHNVIHQVLIGIIGLAAIGRWFVLPFSLSYTNYIFSAMFASLFFVCLVYGSRYILKKEGMGFGDVQLAFVMGLLLGSPGIIVALYIAFLTGAFLSVILILSKRKRFGQTVPFGPFLVVGTLIVLFKLVPQGIEQFIVPYYYF
ncbi:MAG: prepilin peptidase [Candidatus Roizmanbacteria bacterium]|nr:prepilin peptidase [Candidatus Roizmanbacteria bacterium]